MKITYATLLFLLPLSLFGQSTQPVNVFSPEKNYTQEKIAAGNYDNAAALLQYLVRDFELDGSRLIAVLVNGKYQTRIYADGKFDSDIAPKRLNEKITPGAVERIELRYNPAYNAPVQNDPYVGTINFVVPALNNPEIDPNNQASAAENPEPWNDPIVNRLKIASGEASAPVKRPAYTSIRAGGMVGILAARLSPFVSLQVEVPISKNLILCAAPEWSLKSSSRLVVLPLNDTIGEQYNLRTFAPSVTVKYYLPPSYPRFYLNAGPFLERGRGKWTYSARPDLDTQTGVYSTLGVNAGVGILFYSRLNFYIGLSGVLTNKNNLPPHQALRGAVVGIGWLLGKR